MRTLCLNLQRDEKPSVAENFLIFSPRVHYRAPGLVFLDISSTAKLFGGERNLMNEALQVSREFFPETAAAISDTPWGAQVLCHESPETISAPTQESSTLAPIPLARLHQLEGLLAWNTPREVEDIIDFFHMLGVHRLGEIRSFQVESFRERWQDTGHLIWKRLHGLDKQVISPLLPTEALQDFIYLDFPVSLVSFLLHCLEKTLTRLMARLQGRGEFAQKIILQLFCEFSEKVHVVELTPASPNRNLELFMKLLEHKLSDINLENPIQQIQIEVIPCPEKVQQLDFWQPRISDFEKLDQLVGLFNQAQITTGFLKPKDEILPDEAWAVSSEFEEFEPIDDHVEVDGHCFQIQPAYSHFLQQAPRPSRLLRKPKRLQSAAVQKLQFLSSHPIERLEESWWETSRGRDYYFALSRQGEFLWVFYDRIEHEYYLHGYFD